MVLPVDVCNWALLRLGQNRINSIEPPFTSSDRGVAATCAFLYPLTKDAALRAHPWSFARKRVELAADGSDPVHGFANRYRKPADFIRLIEDKPCRDWQLEGAFILTDDDAPLELVYIHRADEALFDPLFVKVLACTIAIDLVEKITTSNVKKNILVQELDGFIAEARRTNAIEQPKRVPPEDSFVLVRR